MKSTEILRTTDVEERNNLIERLYREGKKYHHSGKPNLLGEYIVYLDEEVLDL